MAINNIASFDIVNQELRDRFRIEAPGGQLPEIVTKY